MSQRVRFGSVYLPATIILFTSPHEKETIRRKEKTSDARMRCAVLLHGIYAGQFQYPLVIPRRSEISWATALLFCFLLSFYSSLFFFIIEYGARHLD